MTIKNDTLINLHNAQDGNRKIRRITPAELASYQGIEEPERAWITEIEIEGIEGDIVLDGPELQIHVWNANGDDIISWAYENCSAVQAEATMIATILHDQETGLGFNDLPELGFQHIAGDL